MQLPPLSERVATLRRTVTTGTTRPVEWRLAQLETLRRLIVENDEELTRAVTADVGKPALEVRLTETSFLVQELDHVVAHLESWLRPRSVSLPATLLPGKGQVQLQPKGVVLVIAPWNYPVQLLLSPVTGALAAGNTVMLKPSEITPTVAAVVARLVGEYFPDDVAQVVTGGVDETTALLEQRFDHIFFTGSPRVGKIVMRAAAEHLTPVTLELGGKSPAFVDGSVDARAAARRLAWGKFTNAGQTCIAPDYVLVTPEARDDLVAALATAVKEFFGTDPQASADLGRIVDGRQHERLVGLLDGHGGTVAVGGEHDAGDRFYLAPTVITDPDPESPLMTEEIFGPILPVLTVADEDAAIDFITAREKPLALYVLTDEDEVREAFEQRTSSGGMAFGAPLLHVAAPELPFGGVGNSGMGAYHGRASVEELCHHRSVLSKPLTPDTLAVVYPPMPSWKRTAITKVMAPLRSSRLPVTGAVQAVKRRLTGRG